MAKRKKTGKNQTTAPPWHLLEPWQTTAWLKVDPERGLDSRKSGRTFGNSRFERYSRAAASKCRKDFLQ